LGSQTDEKRKRMDGRKRERERERGALLPFNATVDGTIGLNGAIELNSMAIVAATIQ